MIKYIIIFTIILVTIIISSLPKRKTVEEENEKIYGKIKNIIVPYDSEKKNIYIGGEKYDIKNLPKDFLKNENINKFIEKYTGHNYLWNIYSFNISEGFEFTEYKISGDRPIIFIFKEKWNISNDFNIIHNNNRWIVPEKNSVFIAKKGDIISTTKYKGKSDFNFILLY